MGKARTNKKSKKIKGGSYASLEPEDGEPQPPRRKSKRTPKKTNKNLPSHDADLKLRHAVEGDGSRTIIDIEADGNCLFRAISDQLYHDYGRNHAEIRHEICNYIAGYKEDFAVFLVLDDADAVEDDGEDASDFESYIRSMRQDGDWGGNLELVAAARMYRRNITVFSARLDAYTIEHGSSKKSAGPDLLVTYHDNDHYNSVRSAAGGKPPPPIKTYSVDDDPMAIDDSAENDDKDAEMIVTAEEENGITVATNNSTESNGAVGDTLASTTTNNNNAVAGQQQQQQKKNSPCHCGSGLRYKKCCLAKEKQAARQRKMQFEYSITTGHQLEDKKEKDGITNGDFRVLRI